MKPNIEIAVEYERWNEIDDLQAFSTKAIHATVAALDIQLLEDAEVSIVFSNDASVRILNKTWRKQDKPTNVLSFPVVAADEISEAPLLGDIVLAFETVSDEAATETKTLSHHVTHLLIHGFLHLLGYDHEDEDEASEMEAQEVKILAQLGIPDPYAESVSQAGRGNEH